MRVVRCLFAAILDPEYGPPERVVDPLGKGPEKGKALWNASNPPLFDAYSIGLVVLQLAVPSLRGRRGMKRLRRELARRKAGEHLSLWRESFAKKEDDFTLLDANGGRGWDFVKKLVRYASAKPPMSFNLD